MLSKISLIAFYFLSTSVAISGCTSAKEQARKASAVAPVPSITISKPLQLRSKTTFGHDDAFIAPGTYLPTRRYAKGTLYMDEDELIQVNSKNRAGGIYWKDGLNSPNSFAFYQSELVPTIRKTNELNFIRR